MIVVSDASPICYLVLIEEIEVLAKLFTEVHVPRQQRNADKPATEWPVTRPVSSTDVIIPLCLA
jgi:predicted nucleic acid-binding protein